MDIMMPKMDGLLFTKHIRDKNIKTPIAFLTARTSIEDRVNGLETGGEYYLAKPFDFDELLAVIRAMARKYSDNMKVGENTNKIWIRGFISTTEPSHLMETIILLTSILLPFILVLSIGGGWVIAKHSMRQLETIIEAVDSINDGDDLSARINMGKGPTEMRRLSEEFDKMFGRLEKSFEVEKQFATDVSHELKTPITVILGQCHRAKRKEYDVSECKQALELIEKQGQRMSELVEQLLSITRLQQGTDKFPMKAMNFSVFVEACVEDFKSGIGAEKDIKLDIESSIFTDFNPALISRVIFNLLDNARKYTDDAGIIRVMLRKKGYTILLTVEDNGVGIEEKNLSNIWNRFW